MCECKLSKGELAGLGGKTLTRLLRTGHDLQLKTWTLILD